MNNKLLYFTVYPAKQDGMTSKQRKFAFDYLKEHFGIDDQLIDTIVKDNIDINTIDFPQNTSYKDKLSIYTAALKIIDSESISYNQLIALSEVATILKIKPEDTGLDFNIYDSTEILEKEYKKTLINFSMIAGVIGLIPTPIPDIFILTPIQIGMVTKLSSMFKYKLDAIEFIKLMTGTIGAGVILKFTSKILNSFIPFIGWAINGSIAFSGTYAMGILARKYAEAEGELSEETISRIWEESYKEGKEEFFKLKDFILSKKDDLIREFNEIKNKKQSGENETQENPSKDTPVE